MIWCTNKLTLLINSWIIFRLIWIIKISFRYFILSYSSENFGRILSRDPRRKLIDISISLIPERESTRAPFHFIAKRRNVWQANMPLSRIPSQLIIWLFTTSPHTCVCIVMRRHRVAATRNGHDESQSAMRINRGSAIYQPGLSPFPS